MFLTLAPLLIDQKINCFERNVFNEFSVFNLSRYVVIFNVYFL